MDAILLDHFSCKNVDFRLFDGVPWVWVYGVTSVECGHLADSNQNVALDLTYSEHKFQEHH